MYPVGDLNEDGIVDAIDLSILAANWGSSNPDYDLNGDGTIDSVDLSILVANWGQEGSGEPDQVLYGAQLPIQYDLGALTGTIRYVAPDGNDANSGTNINAPKATLASAISASSAGQTIVVRGGVYRNQREIAVAGSRNNLTVIAYPGEIPIFNGAVVANTGWNNEGSLRWRNYTPRLVTSEFGINFPGNQGTTPATGHVGKYPDQVWIGEKRLRQVLSQGEVNDDTFWVDFANERLYITATNLALGDVEISRSWTGQGDRDRFLIVQAHGFTMEGLRIIRYSNNANSVGVVVAQANFHGHTFRNIEIIENAYMAMQMGFSDDLLVENVTIHGANWMGISLNQTDRSTIRYVDWKDINPWDQFTTSPQSGAIKTSRCRDTVVEYCRADNVRSHGIWFDQSNINIVIASNIITNHTSGAGVYFEISEGLKLVNNYIHHVGNREPVQLAGSSEVEVINNTLIGGANPLGVYTDGRSIPGCSDGSGQCGTWWQSDVQTRFPIGPTMDWMPRMKRVINNIIAYPTAVRFFGQTTPVGFLTTNGAASQPIEKMLHQDNDPHTGLTRTVWDGNVYANGSGAITRVSSPSATYTTVSSWSAAMASSPVSLSGIDSNSLKGNEYVNADGSPTGALLALSDQAVPVPVDSDINKYLAADTQAHGAQL